MIYISFNGADEATYERMMGGLKYDRAIRHLRSALALAEGTRLKISANISVTKANRHQLTAITELLKREGMSDVSYAMAHTRGGNLRDPEVVDTPVISSDVTHCDVVRGTLFIDWRGKVLICDHDLHGEYSLGDLTTEPMETIQSRRQTLIENGVPFKICGVCSDVLKMGTNLFGDLRSGTLREWIYDVYRTEADEKALPDATPNQAWLYRLYEKEGRLHRMVNGLLKRNKILEADLSTDAREHTNTDAVVRHFEKHMAEARTTIDRLNEQARALATRVCELDQLAKEREARIIELDAERKRVRSLKSWRLLRLASILRRR
jgi:hypothetical protein